MRNSCKDCIYYHKENRTCQSKKCATGGSGKVSWVDRLFCSPCKKKVEDAPTVDAVIVTRCKDCVHYDFGVCLKIYSDGNVHPEAWQSRKPEDFCSYGERKDGGDG